MGMVGAVNTAEIKLAWVTKTGTEKYEVYAQWTLRTSAPAGKIWLWVREDKKKFVVREFTEGDEDGTITLEGATPGHVYEIGISDSESEYSTDKCKPRILLLDSYEGVGCEYDGRLLSVKWKPHNARICYGYIRVADVNDSTAHMPVVKALIPQYTRGITLQAPAVDYDASVPLRVRLTPCIDEISCGPPVLSGCICTQPAQILEVEWQQLEKGARLTVQVSQTYDAQKLGLGAKLALYSGQRRMLCSPASPVTAAPGEAFTMEWEITDEGLAAMLDELTLALWLGQDDTWSVCLQPQNTVSLCRPVISASQRGRTCVLDWSCSDAQKPCFKLSGHEGTVAGWRQEIPLTKASQVDDSYSVRRAGDKLGPASAAAAPFRPGFYPDEDGNLICCQQSYKGTETKLPLAGLCKQQPAADISVGPLCFGKDGTLTIKTHVSLTRSDCTAFIRKMEENGLTVRGSYRLRSVLARHAKCAEQDRLFLSCALDPENHSVSIMPGMLLHIQAAAYSRQNGENAEDNGGFVQGASAEYMVSMAEEEGGTVLCMDSFFQRMKPAWEPYALPAVSADTVRYAGGLDLFFKTVKQPYWSIWFPYNFPLAASEPSPFVSDNITLLAGAGSAELETALGRLNENPTLPLNLPHLVPNGRSFISLRQTLCLNGAFMTAPVGSTLEDVLTLSGACVRAEQIKLTRNTQWGALPVYTAWLDTEACSGLTLLPGDRIEVW